MADFNNLGYLTMAGQQQNNLLAQALRSRPANSLFGGIQERQPYPSENDYFRGNPHVGGMAAQDNRVVLNPYSSLNPQELDAIRRNEAARAYMRMHDIQPTFEMTPEQQATFAGYSPDPLDQRSTIAARMLSGDRSAGNYTPDQSGFVNLLRALMMNR